MFLVSLDTQIKAFVFECFLRLKANHELMYTAWLGVHPPVQRSLYQGVDTIVHCHERAVVFQVNFFFFVY